MDSPSVPKYGPEPSPELHGRGDWIRTNDLLLPKQALYQAELRPGRRFLRFLTSSRQVKSVNHGSNRHFAGSFGRTQDTAIYHLLHSNLPDKAAPTEDD